MPRCCRGASAPGCGWGRWYPCSWRVRLRVSSLQGHSLERASCSKHGGHREQHKIAFHNALHAHTPQFKQHLAHTQALWRRDDSPTPYCDFSRISETSCKFLDQRALQTNPIRAIHVSLLLPAKKKKTFPSNRLQVRALYRYMFRAGLLISLDTMHVKRRRLIMINAKSNKALNQGRLQLRTTVVFDVVQDKTRRGNKNNPPCLQKVCRPNSI